MSKDGKPTIRKALSAGQILNQLLGEGTSLSGRVLADLKRFDQRRRKLLIEHARQRRAKRAGTARRDGKDAPANHFIEGLEGRIHLSSVTGTQTNLEAAVTAVFSPTFKLYKPDGITPAASGSAPTGITPAQMQTAYGVNLISFGGITGNGSGQTIAIVDAYNQPDIASDLSAFDQNYSLQQMNQTGGPTFTQLNESGGTTLPSADVQGGWGVEISLDVEWAHVIAPQANIVLVEASSNSESDLYQAVTTAADLPGVSVVSMSWGGPEDSSDLSDNSIFTTPSGHTGVTFVASTGDSGVPSGYPAYSPNVVAVGGTTLNISSSGAYESETGWSDSGGGISTVESQPAYQSGVVPAGITTTMRTNPDVAMDADPDTGVSVYDTYDFGTSDPWQQVGGTSLASPMFAGLIAIANQGRSIEGLAALDGRSGTLPLLYSMSPSNFHDITSGNNGYSAGPGYDLVTGLGSPVANLMVQSLAGAHLPQLAFSQQPGNAAAAAAISPAITVDVETSSGAIDTTDNSSVTLSINTGPNSATLDGTLTEAAVDGVATFSNISLPTSGTYTLRASDSASLVLAAISHSFAISPGAGTQLGFGAQPSDTGVDEDLNNPGGVQVDVLDANGNLATSVNSTSVTIALASNPTSATLGGTLTEPVVDGVATFSNLTISALGTYTLKVTDPSYTSVTSNSFTIGNPSPAQLAFVQQPTDTVVGANVTPAITVDVEDQGGNLVTSDDSYVSLYIATGPGSDDSRPVTVEAVNGVATFDVYLTETGTYTLEAIDSDFLLTPAISDSFTIFAGPAAELAFIQGPVSGSAGVAISPAVTVAVEDQYGNTVTTDSSDVTIAIKSGPSGASLGGTLTVAAVDGVATFSDLSLADPGNYKLQATDPGPPELTSVTSNTFTIVPDSFQTLGTFDGTNGSEPEAGLIMDSQGNLYGTTSGAVGSSYTGDGTVFEIAVGTDTVTTLASFTGNNGSVPEAGLIIDSNGNLYGTTTGLNDENDDGTVFELAKGSSTITTLATFDGSNGSVPVAGLIMDSNGNLYGATTGIDDSSDGGTIFELAKGSSTVITLATFNGSNGSVPEATLIMDSSGNLYGTTTGLDDLDDDGTVFELPKDSGAITTLATFNGSNGSEPYAGLIMDSSGNLYGTTSGITQGFHSSHSDGTVFELPKDSSTITTLVTFNGSNGSEPLAGLIMDSSGNLYGTTTGAHDPDDYGTVFELAKGSTSVLTLATFTGDNGSVPEAPLILDSNGNLYGTTTGLDDSSDDGTVFELSPLAPKVLPTQLAFVQQPTNAAAGATITPAVTVDVEDVNGNLLATDNSDVTLSIATGPTGATLGGTATVAAVDGVATFSNLDLTVAGAYTLIATDSSLAAATSNSFTIAAAAATHLAVSQQPSNTTAGLAISPAVTIDVLDAFGNLVTTDNSNVTMALAITPAISTPDSTVPILGGTLTVTASAGVATFSNLTLNTAGTYSLIATDSSLPGVASVTTNSFTVSTANTTPPVNAATPVITWAKPADITYGTPLSATQLDATASYDGTPVAGTFAYAPAAGTVLHAGANQTLSVLFTPTDTADYTTADGTTEITVNQATPVITWSKPANIPAGTALSATQLDATVSFDGTAVAGTFAYAPLAGTILSAGTHALSTEFTPTDTTDYTTADASVQISAGPAITSFTTNSPVVTGKTLTFTADGVTTESPTTIRAVYFYVDTLGAGVFSSKDRLLGAGTLIKGSTNYVLTVSTASLRVGTDSFFARALDSKGNYSSATYVTAVIDPAAPDKLVFTTQPAKTTTAGATMAAVVVKIEDSHGNIETSDNSAVTLSIATGPPGSGGTFANSSTTTVNAVDGVATFSNLVLDTAGTYTLTASDTTDKLSKFKSSSFKITPGSVASVTFVKQPPTTTTAGKTISPAVTVVVKDAYGNVLAGQTVKLAIATGPTGASLLGTLTVKTNSAGIATFPGISFHVAGTYTLTAKVGSISSAASSNLTISPAKAARMVFTTAPPKTVTAGSAFPVAVEFLDAYGNLATSANGTMVKLSLASSPKKASLGGISTAIVINGAATFANVTLSIKGTYRLRILDALDGLSITPAAITAT